MKLLEPVTLNGMTLPNRIVVPAMVTRLSGEDGFVNDAVRDRYLRFAHGRPGLIVVEAMSVHGGRSGPLLRLSDDPFVPGHAAMVRAIHDGSPSKVAAQIIHFLKIARSGWRQTIADLSVDEIKTIVTAMEDRADCVDPNAVAEGGGHGEAKAEGSHEVPAEGGEHAEAAQEGTHEVASSEH